jgi:hypothetical protein
MTPKHEQVLAAIDKARPNADEAWDPNEPWWVIDRGEFCDFMRATAERHAPAYLNPPKVCVHGCTPAWPCPDYRQVIDRLQSWGYLTERTD